MNVPTNNVQVIEKDGQPMFVVIPFEDYQKMYLDQMAAEGYVPHEVVGKMIKEQKSLAQAWREHLGLTQEEVAKRMGITQAALSQIEAPGNEMKKATVKKLAAALGIQPAQLTR